jgi:hypothetical protein
MCFVWSAFNQVTYQLHEADSQTATQGISQILWNPNISDHYCSMYVCCVGKMCDKKNPLTVVTT